MSLRRVVLLAKMSTPSLSAFFRLQSEKLPSNNSLYVYKFRHPRSSAGKRNKNNEALLLRGRSLKSPIASRSPVPSALRRLSFVFILPSNHHHLTLTRMSESSHLLRRNACHSTVRRSTSSSSTSSTLSSSSTLSNSFTPSTSAEDDPLYRAPTRNSLFLKATEVNRTTAKIEQARERRRLERQKLEEEGEWTTGCAILGSEQLLTSEGELWTPGDHHLGLAGSKSADQQFNIASLTPTSQLHLPLVSPPPPPTSPLQSHSKPYTSPPSSSRPPLYPLLIPTQPSERPRSLQPLPRISEDQMLESSGSRRHSWTGGSKFFEDLDLGPVDRWGTEEVVFWLKKKGFGPRVVQVFEGELVAVIRVQQPFHRLISFVSSRRELFLWFSAPTARLRSFEGNRSYSLWDAFQTRREHPGAQRRRRSVSISLLAACEFNLDPLFSRTIN